MNEIKIKPLTEENATLDYVEWLNNTEINQYLESRFIEHSKKTIAKYITELNESKQDYLFGIFDKELGKHIGNIKIGPVNPIYRRAEVGLLIGDKNYWGKGIASKAIGLICDYSKNELDLHKLEAGCYADNIGSLKAFLKSGFVIEGQLKDHFRNSNQWCDAYRLGKILVP